MVIALLFDIRDISDYTGAMASIIIRNLDEKTKAALRLRAARVGRSMEEEMRHILRAVLAWMDQQDPAALATTSITCAEILRGIAELPVGKRREQLRVAADSVFDDFFGDAILAFDRFCAPVYAEIAAGRKARGRPILRTAAWNW